MARFCEIFRCAGVDEAADPQTMVVPFGGTNFVALDGDDFKNLHVIPRRKSIEIDELESTSATVGQFLLKRDELHKPAGAARCRFAREASIESGYFFWRDAVFPCPWQDVGRPPGCAGRSYP